MGKIRVINSYVGGGFGGKAEATALEFCSAILSRRTGRPVRMVYDRREMFLHGRGRHKQIITLKTGVKKDGTILAVQSNIVLDCGAYTSYGIICAYYAGSLLPVIYKIPNYKYDGYHVYTNLPACGAQRGLGAVQPRFAFESQLDIIAEELGIDPIEIRLRNAVGPNEMTVNELKIESCEFKQCLEKVREESGWKEKKGKLPKGRGIGIGCGSFISGAGYPIYLDFKFPHSNAVIKVSEDGNIVTLFTGACEIGQGSNTVLSQIAAEELGVLYEDIKIVSGDTEIAPLDLGAYASRETLMAGNAVKMAAMDAKMQILKVVSEKLNVPTERLIARRRKIFDREEPAREISFAEAASLAFEKAGPIIGRGHYSPPKLGGKFKGARVGPSPAYSYCAAVAEVEVDMETGKVKVLKFTDVHDCGTVINPMVVHGQIEGATVMGIGEGLYEQVVFDKGDCVNPNLYEYLIPSIYEAPEFYSLFANSYENAGPFGAKEVGEGASLPVIPAIANAIYDAIGIRIKELPITAEKVLEELKKTRVATNREN